MPLGGLFADQPVSLSKLPSFRACLLRDDTGQIRGLSRLGKRK
jgi:hypothetical protein